MRIEQDPIGMASSQEYIQTMMEIGKSIIYVISLFAFFSSAIADPMSHMVRQENELRQQEIILRAAKEKEQAYLKNIYWDIESIADLKQQEVTLEDTVGKVNFLINVEETRKYRNVFKKMLEVSGASIDLAYMAGTEPFAEIREYDDHLYITISLGFIQILSSDDEFAIIIGHELAHITYSDAESRKKRRGVGEIVSGVGAVVGAFIPFADFLTYGLVDATLKKYTVDDEIEADTAAIEWANEAGYDIHAAINLFNRLKLRSENEKNNYLSYYGYIDKRIENIRNTVNSLTNN